MQVSFCAEVFSYVSIRLRMMHPQKETPAAADNKLLSRTPHVCIRLKIMHERKHPAAAGIKLLSNTLIGVHQAQHDAPQGRDPCSCRHLIAVEKLTAWLHSVHS